LNAGAASIFSRRIVDAPAHDALGLDWSFNDNPLTSVPLQYWDLRVVLVKGGAETTVGGGLAVIENTGLPRFVAVARLSLSSLDGSCSLPKQFVY